jgi:hypothetical protein
LGIGNWELGIGNSPLKIPLTGCDFRRTSDRE